MTLFEAGQYGQAGEICSGILATTPRHAEALHLRGLIHFQAGDSMAALHSINAAILAEPGRARFHFNLGVVLTGFGEHEAAAASYQQAVRLQDDHASAWFNLGKAAMDCDELPRAIGALERAFELQPDLPGLRSDLAVALIMLCDRSAGLPEQALHCARCITLLSGHWQDTDAPHASRLMLAYCLQQAGRLSEAEAEYCGVLDDQPAPGDELKAHSNIANCYNTLGRMDQALAHYRHALAMKPDLADTASSIAACINYDPEATPQAVFDTHRDWARRFARQDLQQTRWVRSHDAQRTLRVGLVSPDLRRHPVAALCAGMLPHLPAHGIEVHAYYNFATTDIISERLRGSVAAWHAVHALDDEKLAAQIDADGIDILIDMAGHTTYNRLGVFARKPAPLQVSWLGYFNSTGLDTFDAFLSDPWSSPAGQEAWFAERLVHLPHTRFCYQPWEFTPEVNELSALATGQVTFGSFNNLAKLNERVLALWGRVIQATPGSRLVVQTKALDDRANMARFAALAASHGIPAGRLELRGFMPLEQVARAWQGIDIALDPFPFCGGMTSFDALWMGVPVVTLEQPLIAGRQTLSMLHNLGLPELVATGADDYVRIASALARDLPRLARLRQELRPRFAASPLADHAGFARDWSSALRQLWQAYLQSARH
jgi:protein O-GlcNAc transferase